MHPAGLRAEQLTIQHQGQPDKRMPVGRIARSKSPDDAVMSQALQNVGIFVNIGTIIIVDEIEIPDLPEDQHGAK